MKKIAKNETDSKITENLNFIMDKRHWTKQVKPITARGKEIVPEPYNPTTFIGDHSSAQELSAISLKEIYESIQEKSFQNGLSVIAGLYNLIKHNPHLQPEANAIRALAIGEEIMHQFIIKVENL